MREKGGYFKKESHSTTLSRSYLVFTLIKISRMRLETYAKRHSEEYMICTLSYNCEFKVLRSSGVPRFFTAQRSLTADYSDSKFFKNVLASFITLLLTHLEQKVVHYLQS